MQKSESLQNLAAALVKFHLKVDKIKKDAKNPFFKSSYASLSNILEQIDTPLIESGIAVSQFPTGDHGLTTILIHADSGEYMMAEYIMKPVKDDPQGIGSSITYQRRYALAAILGLNIDDDDDANAASKKTTAYNHKPLSQPGKPLISNAQFRQLMDRVRAGDLEAYEKAVSMFSFEPTQKQLLETEIKKIPA